MAAASASGPVPRSGRMRRRHKRSEVVNDAQVEVTATPPNATDATPAMDATRRAARALGVDVTVRYRTEPSTDSAPMTEFEAAGKVMPLGTSALVSRPAREA